MSNLREECGVFGIYALETADIARTAYYGLFALQHRGQESCGIVVNDDGVFTTYKDTGLVNDVFTPDILERFGNGRIAVGHVRYGTTGTNDRNNALSWSITSREKWRWHTTEIWSTRASFGTSWSCRGRSSTPQAIPR